MNLTENKKTEVLNPLKDMMVKITEEDEHN